MKVVIVLWVLLGVLLAWERHVGKEHAEEVGLRIGKWTRSIITGDVK